MPELAVVIPTFNELENVQPVVDAVSSALQGIDFELLFVDDDSPDGTARRVLEMSRTDPRVRLVHRINRRGLSSAVVEGMMASNALYLAVMDGDMQHDETVLPDMLRRLQTSEVDLVVGTRHREGGSMGESSWVRVALSQLGRRLSAFVCHADVSDPMSGFFALRRGYLDEVVRNLSCVGFKLLVNLLASSKRPVRFQEVGYTFRNRLHGHSKLDLVVGLEYLELLLDKLVGEWIPVRYALFGMIGAVGVVAQLALIRLLLYFGRLTFDTAQVTFQPARDRTQLRRRQPDRFPRPAPARLALALRPGAVRTGLLARPLSEPARRQRSLRNRGTLDSGLAGGHSHRFGLELQRRRHSGMAHQPAPH